MDLKLESEEYLPLRDVVFKTLRSAIIEGKLEPGERLMEIKLANMLGVSRTPVREAIRKLELEGLVIMNARRGAIVAPITESDLIDVLNIRSALESLSVELACEKITDDDIQMLETSIEEIKEAIADDDIMRIAELDVKFHETINAISRNKRLISLLQGLKEHIYRYRLEYIKDIKVKEKIVEDHRKILEAMIAKDVKKARKELRSHIEGQEKYILEHLNN